LVERKLFKLLKIESVAHYFVKINFIIKRIRGNVLFAVNNNGYLRKQVEFVGDCDSEVLPESGLMALTKQNKNFLKMH
jgi:hypothetical protein